ncbi:MAG: hypothetical protein ACRCS6_06330 [Turicibacter sp.]
MEKKTYFISGHTTIDVKDFIKLYVPLIDVALKEGANFVIGDNDGVDAMAQSYLKQKIDESEHSRVKIFYKGNLPQNFLSFKFMAVGDFVSHLEASVAMTLCSDEDIVCLDEDKRASMTASNILRRFTPKFNFEKFARSEKRNEKFWDVIWYGKTTEVEE